MSEEPPTPPPPGSAPRRPTWLEMFPTHFAPQSYPDIGPLSVAARLVFLVACLAVAFTALGPHAFKPRLVGHYHLQRFAAWYLLSGSAAAAMPRARLRWLGLGLILFAVLAECLRALPGPFGTPLRENIYADIGGVYALFFPLVLARWRDAVRPPE